MKKTINLLFIGLALVATSCSELQEYELPYEVAPTAQKDITGITVTPSNSLCPGPEVDFSVDSEATIYYIPVPADQEAPTSFEIWEAGSVLPAEELASGTGSVTLELNTLGDYVLYAISVNQHGIRSEEVSSQEFSTSSFEEVVNHRLVTEFDGTAYYGSSELGNSSVSLTPAAEGQFTFTSDDLWGPDVIAALTGIADYTGFFPYPATVTINSDFSVTVTSEIDLGGEGSYNPCTGELHLSLLTNIFDDPDTEEVEAEQVDVELTPAVADPGV